MRQMQGGLQVVTLTKDQIDALVEAKNGGLRRIFGSYLGAHPSTIKALLKRKHIEATYPCYGEVKYKPTKQGWDVIQQQERSVNLEEARNGK